LYIEKGSKCNGTDLLIKQIIAVPRDNVILEKNAIIVNNIKFNFPIHGKNSVGRVSRSYSKGSYRDTKGYWLVGTHSPNSWDSRYWEAFSNKNILYGLKPILVF